jgi:hypothetical protein
VVNDLKLAGDFAINEVTPNEEEMRALQGARRCRERAMQAQPAQGCCASCASKLTVLECLQHCSGMRPQMSEVLHGGERQQLPHRSARWDASQHDVGTYSLCICFPRCRALPALPCTACSPAYDSILQLQQEPDHEEHR